MKLTTGILAVTLMAGGIGATQVVAQNTDAIDNARSVAKSLQQKQTVDSSAALAVAGSPDKPTPGAPAPAVKPAVIPGSQATVSQSPVSLPAAKSAAASSSHIQLQHVTVTPGSDSIQIELSSTDAVTPRVSKLSSPARILVELPGTVSAAPQNHIAIGSGGVKGLRIGTDGKTPPTTSVVVDLEKAIAYDVTPGSAGKLILTLHADGSTTASAKSTTAPAKAKAQTQTAPVVATAKSAGKESSAAKTVSAKSAAVTSTPAPATSAAKTSAPTLSSAAGKTATASALKTAAATKEVPAKETPKEAVTAALAAKTAAPSVSAMQSPEAKPAAKPEEKKWAMNGKRDPFFSPVVQQPSGSGCSTGKKCLEIGNINLRGVVKSDNGFIAVVTNSLNKAYFLRENDPVFNGYVMKITGDSVVFQETVEDKLGKPFTREVVKRIFTPAV